MCIWQKMNVLCKDGCGTIVLTIPRKVLEPCCSLTHWRTINEVLIIRGTGFRADPGYDPQQCEFDKEQPETDYQPSPVRGSYSLCGPCRRSRQGARWKETTQASANTSAPLSLTESIDSNSPESQRYTEGGPSQVSEAPSVEPHVVISDPFPAHDAETNEDVDGEVYNRDHDSVGSCGSIDQTPSRPVLRPSTSFFLNNDNPRHLPPPPGISGYPSQDADPR